MNTMEVKTVFVSKYEPFPAETMPSALYWDGFTAFMESIPPHKLPTDEQRKGWNAASKSQAQFVMPGDLPAVEWTEYSDDEYYIDEDVSYTLPSIQ